MHPALEMTYGLTPLNLPLCNLIFLLDRSFEDIDEIYISNEFGKSYILKPPKRSRIIVQKKELEKSNNYVIKITIIQ